MKKLSALLVIAIVAGLSLFVGSRTGESQAGQLTLAIYAPSVNFGTSAARLEYLQRLGASLERATGKKVRPQAFSNLAQLQRAKPDFAIIEGQCVATKTYKVLANAVVGGSTSRCWALYSNVGGSMQALKGKKLAYMKTGCNDNAFLENAMLDSEVDVQTFFSGIVGKGDLNGAVAEVATLRGAEAVFAPSGSQKGLTKVFDTGSVPNPAFVQIGNVPASVSAAAQKAVVGFGGGGAISGWSDANPKAYTSLRSSMGKRVKKGIFAAPSPVRVDASDVLIFPETLDDSSLTEISQHFEEPPARQE